MSRKREMPVDPALWTEKEREQVNAGYAEVIDSYAATLVAAGRTVEDAVRRASGVVAATSYSAIYEGIRRVREKHGLPDFSDLHREVSTELAHETLLRHSGGEIDDQSLQDLLVDLVHWAGPESFDDALEDALTRFEEEIEEDQEAELEALEAPAVAAGMPKPPSDKEAAARRAAKEAEQQRIARLYAHTPARYDA